MRRSVKLGVAVAALALAVPLATVQAAPALAVHIEVETTFDESGSGGPLTASGSAVDAGLICEAGDTVPVFEKGAGFQSPGDSISLQVVIEFSCASGSTFLAKLQARLDAHGDRFAWSISDGTGAYRRSAEQARAMVLTPWVTTASSMSMTDW